MNALVVKAYTQRTNYGYRFTPMETKKSNIPKSFIGMFKEHIKSESLRIGKDPVNTHSVKINKKMKKMKLSNESIWERENLRDNEDTPKLMYLIYLIICKSLDIVYNNRPIQRFWFLETVARMPYFSYVAVLHLYETLGWWKISTNLRRIHAEEEWNETHHLHIMEILGGDRYFFDRILASHSAIAYYTILFILFLTSPNLSYKFSELLENHAVDTYEQFIEENAELLETLPVPLSMYDIQDNIYYTNLLDVFTKIRDDEQGHANSMKILTKKNT